MMIPNQLRAARALLGWNRDECAAIMGLSPETIKNIETEVFNPSPETIGRVLLTLSDHGIELIGRWGVILLPDAMRDEPHPGSRAESRSEAQLSKKPRLRLHPKTRVFDNPRAAQPLQTKRKNNDVD